MKPKNVSAADASAKTDAFVKLRSMTKTPMAPSIRPPRIEPSPITCRPWYRIPSLPSLSKPTAATLVPAASSALSICSLPHAARCGVSASMMAGAWLFGVSWNDCAPISMPM